MRKSSKCISHEVYTGVRVTGDSAWLEKRDWKDFVANSRIQLTSIIANQRLTVLCTYPLAAFGPG